MPRHILFQLSIVSLLLGTCTLTTGQDQAQPATSTMPPLAGATATPPPVAHDFPTLESFTGPYASALSLLDNVCFEFLYTLDGETWNWQSAADLTAFYNRVDASELCIGPVARSGFDFEAQWLVGAVSVRQGCDAAYSFVESNQDAAARTQTLIFELVVQPGCAYELVQPLLIGVPPPPSDHTLQITILQ